MKIIDPHIHLFDLALGKYDWLKTNNPPFWPDKEVINRNFDIDSLLLSKSIELFGAVHIEAGFNNEHPEEEIAWLETKKHMPLRTIAGINLTSEKKAFEEKLITLSSYESCVGCRHILDDEALLLLTNNKVLINFDIFDRYNWIFETQLDLTDSAAMPALTSVINRCKNTTFIINHAGFPKQSETNQIWLENIEQLAALDNVVIKCSGLEMVERDYTSSNFKHIMENLIDTFDANKIMMASNFPLTLFSYSYEHYWQMVVNNLPEHVITKLCFDNAYNIYRFGK